ncbi:hypothetical protein BsWGS_12224 [Bradybaena similaris]
MQLDDVVGEFGLYQKWIYFLVCLTGIPGAFQTLNGVFTLAVPEHRCALPGLDNDTYKSQGEWHDDMVKSQVPWDADTDAYSECQLFQFHNSSNETVSCSRWVYNQDPFETTFVTETNLVCDDISLRTYANMIVMGGLLGGSFIMGSLSDMIGRKKVLVIGVFGQLSCGLASAFVKSYIPYVILRFFTTFFGIGMFLSAFVIGMELVAPSKRKVAGIVIEIFWTAGLFIETGIAYGLRTWNYLQIALSIPSAVLLLYICLLPESPRWLINKGKYEEASKVLRHAAKRNGVDIPDHLLDFSKMERERKGESVWKMFTIPRLLIRSLVIFYNWFVASMVYYGLSLNVGNLSGDIYLNFFLSSLVELASYFFCLLVLDYTGRKPLQCFSMLLGGVACICTLFPVIFGHSGLSWITLVLSLVGKFGASAGFAVIYIFTAELFPTVMRNSGIGLSSFCARLGGILAPYIADAGRLIEGDFSVALPLLIFGGASILAGLLALSLPETSDKALPETVEEAKYFGRKTSPHNGSLDKDGWQPDETTNTKL